MAFQAPTLHRPSLQTTQSASAGPSLSQEPRALPSESQEWILFAPDSQTASSTRDTEATRTPGLSRTSGLEYFSSTARSAQPGSSILDDEATEDAELDSLDDGLHAFREPALYNTTTHGTNAPVLPAHDGLGSFQASSAPVLEQLWQHEQYNSKRKHEGHHRRSSSVQRHLDTIEEFEAQASEEKRLRIEKWRIEQSQALLEEVGTETQRRFQRTSSSSLTNTTNIHDLFGTTPKQSDFTNRNNDRSMHSIHLPTELPPAEPFWRRITRKFIQDIIGIDEPLLSVILGESLPGEETPRSGSPIPEEQSTTSKDAPASAIVDAGWRDKLLQRIATELGVFPSQLTPHPGAFSTFFSNNADYAGMPVNISNKASTIPSPSPSQPVDNSLASSLGPNFPPTLRDDVHAASWGFEEDSTPSNPESSLNLKKEREYWERELDVRMVFRYLKDRFYPSAVPQTQATQEFRKDDSAHRAAIIRQHHPLINRSHHRSPARLRRDSRLSVRRPGSSCASESLKSGRAASALRSGSSRNYWDLGGSVGSGSIIASGGMMGWGHV